MTTISTVNNISITVAQFDLWRRVRKRRIGQIARFSIAVLRRLCLRFRGPSSTEDEIQRVDKKFELATYLASAFENNYLWSLDGASFTREQRMGHLNTLKEMCTAMDEEFCKIVAAQIKRDNDKNKNHIDHTNNDVMYGNQDTDGAQPANNPHLGQPRETEQALQQKNEKKQKQLEMAREQERQIMRQQEQARREKEEADRIKHQLEQEKQNQQQEERRKQQQQQDEQRKLHQQNLEEQRKMQQQMLDEQRKMQQQKLEEQRKLQQQKLEEQRKLQQQKLEEQRKHLQQQEEQRKHLQQQEEQRKNLQQQAEQRKHLQQQAEQRKHLQQQAEQRKQQKIQLEAKRIVQEEQRKMQESQQRKTDEDLRRQGEQQLQKYKEEQRRLEIKQMEMNIDANYYKRTPIPRTNFTVVLQRDDKRISSSLYPRDQGIVIFNKCDQIMPPWHKRLFDERLRRWEPFWQVLHDTTLNNFNIQGTGLQTAKVDTCTSNSNKVVVQGCVSYAFTIPNNIPNIKWGDLSTLTSGYKTGDRRLILRSVPLTSKPDTHTWPKGTFCQFNGITIPTISQRRQQQHDDKLWKGNSKVLDLTAYCREPDEKKENVLEIVTMEHDAEQNVYGLQLAICEYRSPNDLEQSVPRARVPYEEAVQKARDYVLAQTVSIDDDEDDNNNGSNSSLFHCFQLNCPMSMKPIEIPVRGRDCRHMQCYDLSSFLSSNSFPSGRRWRCVLCDSLVNVYDLVQCELFDRMIKERNSGGNNAEKSMVEFRGDGTWSLEAEKKMFASSNTIRGAKKRNSNGISNNTSSSDADNVIDMNTLPSSKTRKDYEEVIILD